MTELAQAVVNGLQMGFLYALVAVGLTIIWGLMEMINFAHGEFLMLGMFGGWWLSARFGLDPLLAIVPIAVVMYAFGMLVYQQLMRRVQGGDPFTQIFATIGLLFLLQNAVVAVFTSDYRFVNEGLLVRLGGAKVQLVGLTFAMPLLLAAGLALLIFLALYLLIERTEFGLALQATSEDGDAARLVGIRPQRMFAMAWGLGAALVAIAGAILVNFFAVYPQVGLQFTVLAYAIVALGGFGSVLGTLFAALLVGVIQSVTVVYLSPAFKDAFVFASYLLIGPLTRLRWHYFAIATVAIWMIAQPIGASWEYIGGSQGLFIPMKPRAGVVDSALALQFSGPTKAMGYYYAALVLFAVTLALMAVVERSKLGYYFRAIRDDQEAAEGIGIDSRLYKVIARSITAAVFAAAGVLYAFWALSVFPEQVLELNWSTLPIMATVVGGIGRLWGPVLGAVILIPISQIMSTTLGSGPLAGRGIDLIVYGLIIIVIAAFRPTGLLSLPWSRWLRLGRRAAGAPA